MSNSPRLLLHFLSLFAFTHQASAHFNLIKPPPYQIRACNARLGCGPCQPWNSRGATNVTTVWQRGSEVNITWARNNHKDGFYRRSLVPINRGTSEPFKYMNDPEAHEKTAFNWGCWSQGLFKCRLAQLKPCRVDKGGLAYTNLMVVPDVLPDGDYVFSMTWFGGSNRTEVKRKKDAEAKFSNFAACAYVTIRGGDELVDAYKRTFTQGYQEESDKMPDEDLEPHQCWSTSSKVRECGGVKCRGRKVKAMTPGQFNKTEDHPQQLLRSTINNMREERDPEMQQKRYRPTMTSTPSTTPWATPESSLFFPMITSTQPTFTIATTIPSTTSTPSTLVPVISTTPVPSIVAITTSPPSQVFPENKLMNAGEQKWMASDKWKETCGVFKKCIDYCNMPQHEDECLKAAKPDSHITY